MRRTTSTLSFCALGFAALSLSACGKSDEVAKGASGEAAVRAELADATKLKPGQYSSNFEIARFDVPGMPADQAAMVRQMMSSAAATARSYCLTPAEADRGSEDMFRELAKGDGNCEFQNFDVDGENVSGRMVCRGGQGQATATMAMTGTMSEESSTMSMVTDITDASLPQGKAQMEMRVSTRRTGDCTAESTAAAEQMVRDRDAMRARAAAGAAAGAAPAANAAAGAAPATPTK